MKGNIDLILGVGNGNGSSGRDRPSRGGDTRVEEDEIGNELRKIVITGRKRKDL